jgi:hypothetical protein
MADLRRPAKAVLLLCPSARMADADGWAVRRTQVREGAADDREVRSRPEANRRVRTALVLLVLAAMIATLTIVAVLAPVGAAVTSVLSPQAIATEAARAREVVAGVGTGLRARR